MPLILWFMVFGLILALALMQAQAAPTEITVGEAKGGAAAALAPKLLPPDVAARILGGSVHRQWLPGQVYRVIFWEKAEPLSRNMCRRRFHGLDLSNPMAPGHPDDPAISLAIGGLSSGFGYRTAYPSRATAATCASDKGWIAPHAEQVEASLAAVQALTGAMRAAARPGRLRFPISCREDEGGNACADRRAALAGLPLDALTNVTFEPGEPPSRPTLAFGPSRPDGRSWRVTLIQSPRGLAEVQMRRSTIVYH